MTNLNKLLNQTSELFYERAGFSFYEKEVPNKDLLKAAIPILEEIDKSEEYRKRRIKNKTGFEQFIDFLKTLTK